MIYSIWPRQGSHLGGAKVILSGNNFAKDLFIETNEITFGGTKCELVEFSSSKYKTQCITTATPFYAYAYDKYSITLIDEKKELCRKPPFRYYDELHPIDIYNPETSITTNGKTYKTTSSSRTFDYIDRYTPKVIIIIIPIFL